MERITSISDYCHGLDPGLLDVNSSEQAGFVQDQALMRAPTKLQGLLIYLNPTSTE